MELLIQNLSYILVAIAIICTVTSILTELTKELGFLKRIPTSLQVMTTAVLLTVICFLAYASYKNIVIVWYMIFAAVTTGIFIAYITMYGWDSLIKKFKEYYKKDLK